MVIHKDSKNLDVNEETIEQDVVSFKLKRSTAMVGAIALSGAVAFTAVNIAKSPEERAMEAIAELVEEQAENPTVTEVTPTTRIIVSQPDSPPATNIDRPDVTVGSTTPELSAERLLLTELAPVFSDIINAAPVSPFDIALKVDALPDPTENPAALINADMAALSLIYTHAYGDKEIVFGLFDPTKTYANLDSVIKDTVNIGRYRFPPVDDPDYSSDNPNFGVVYRALDIDNLDVYTRDSGNTVVIQSFDMERLHFNYDQEKQGWFLVYQDIVADRVIRTYQKQTVSLESDSGELVTTQVWKLVPKDS